MTNTIKHQLENIDTAIQDLHIECSKSSDVILDSQAAHEALIERQKIIFEGLVEQIETLEKTKERLETLTGVHATN
jgi:flagellar motility protein MotE (MotC chaperone)